MNKDIPKNILISGRVLRRGLLTVSIVISSVLIGIKLDTLQNSSPLYTLIGILVAILGTVLSAYIFIKTMIKQLDQND